MPTHNHLLTDIETLGVNYGLTENWLQHYPHLFSATTITLSAQQQQNMQAIITAIESVIAMPVYQQHVLSWAAPVAMKKPNYPGVFYGYDFHLTAHGAKLIEINTNAGGAALNMLLALATTSATTDDAESHFVNLFLAEWQKQSANTPLQRIAIVDDNPFQQYLYPEFVILQNLLKKHGIDTVIADPQQLSLRNDRLYHHDAAIDLVYNRLTDFALNENRHAVLLKAYQENMVVLTPHPHGYALYADKRNLTILCNATLLKSWHIDPQTIALLQQGIPHTFIVQPDAADTLWETRKTLFFKPFLGYGSKGTYRGDKITKRVFNEILSNGYIAQDLAPPGEHSFNYGDEHITLKYDVRNFVYNGKIHGLATRLYQGQTTNFRTPGGGFALVQI